MTWILLTIGAVLTAYSLLTVIGNERHRAIADYKRKLAEMERKAKEAQFGLKPPVPPPPAPDAS